jgi:predicted AAA+ superfamily ATPase
MDISIFQLLNPWRTGRQWDIPHIERTVTKKIEAWIDEPEILILSGARQVGKTSILYQLIARLLSLKLAKPEDIYYFNLDLAGISEFLEDQASFLRFLEIEKRKKTYVLIDEVQRLADPGLFIKGLHDLRLSVKFILTGSSSLDIRTKTQEALTGRKQVFNISALSFSEFLNTLPGLHNLPALDPDNYHLYLGQLNEALRMYSFYGGYPVLESTEDHEKKMMRLNEIFTSYLEKDIAGFLRVENIPLFRKLVALLAAQQGGLVNIQELSLTLSANRETVSRYIHYLEETFVIKLLRPFFSNPRTELSKMPKIYFKDPGLRNLARGGGMAQRNSMVTEDLGKVLEGIVATCVSSEFPSSMKLNYWRSKAGAEVDFILSDGKPIASIEVKSGGLKEIRVSRGYRSFLLKYKPERSILLNDMLWAEKEISGCAVEAIPTAIFLLQHQV